MNKRKASSLLISIALCAALAGCGEPNGNSTQGSGSNNASAATVQPSASPGVQPVQTDKLEKSAEVFIYTSDAELTELTKRMETISYGSEEELVNAVIEKLMQDGDENQISLWKKMKLKEVQFSQDNVTIDVHVPDSARLGAPGEAFLIDSLRETLFQLDFVHSIQLLVDGEQADSLMGHVELEHPMIRS